MVKYYKYLTKPLHDTIVANNKLLQQLRDNEQQIQAKSKILVELKQQQLRQQASLHTQLMQRSQLLTQVKAQINNKELRIMTLNDNAFNLQKIIRTLQLQRHNQDKPFVELQGKLSWPTLGAISLPFATTYPASSLLHSNGVVLLAPTGQVIHAISAGEVVFSDWLQGYGLLLIIYHGDGYMSLYGRNQHLYKHVGEYVRHGDVIAAVGNSGGFKQPGLYFEIRDHGQPRDPALWCRG